MVLLIIMICIAIVITWQCAGILYDMGFRNGFEYGVNEMADELRFAREKRNGKNEILQSRDREKDGEVSVVGE